jgi:hypothetical protein
MPCDPVIRLPVDCQRLRNNLARYVREGDVPTNTDIKTYDAGTLYCAVDSTATTGTIGELRVRYRVKFTVPMLGPEDLGGESIHLKLYADDCTDAAYLGLTSYTTGHVASPSVTSSGVAPGSTLSVIDSTGNLGLYTASTIGLADTTDTSFLMPNANATWLVTARWAGATGITTIPSLSALGGATVESGFFGGNSGLGFFLAAGTSAVIQKVVTTTYDPVPTSTSNKLTFGGAVGMLTGNMDLYIVRLPTALVTEDEKEQQEIDELKASNKALADRLSRLEFLLTRPSSPHEEEKECDTPADMESSIHVPKSVLQRMLLGK